VNADELAAAALTLARGFAAGGTLWVVAPRHPAHGHHVAVEFVHPVIVGKRALPARCVDPVDLTALRGPVDMVLVIGEDGPDDPTVRIGADDPIEWVLAYHLLWELTHVVFEHPGLLVDDLPPATSEPTGFLYPFIEGDERDASGLLADLATSAQAKAAESRALRAATLAACADQIDACATALRAGTRLFTFGNGGSAADAEAAAELFRPRPAVSLVADPAVLTALANDVGFELVFARQLIAYAAPGDVAMGFSTSGDSPNVLRALTEAKRGGLITVGFAGYDGGLMAAGGAVDHCFVVRSDSVHRIQEAQAALVNEIWRTTSDDGS